MESIWFSYLCVLSPLTKSGGQVTWPLWAHVEMVDLDEGQVSAQSTAVGICPGRVPTGTSWFSERYHFEPHARANANILTGSAPKPAAPSFFNKANMQPDCWMHAQRKVHLILMLSSLKSRFCYSISNSTELSSTKADWKHVLSFDGPPLKAFGQWRV